MPTTLQLIMSCYMSRDMSRYMSRYITLHVTLHVMLHCVYMYVCTYRWGFHGSPKLELVAKPKVGHREVKLTRVTHWIEKKLCEIVDVSEPS